MRTFEAAAMGGCLLVENTSEHRELFGPNLERVVYFESVQELQSAARWLLAHEPDRRRMANAVHTHITRGAHTYRDRLRSILEFTRLPTFGMGA
jgi:spore maturation protein CgeB